MNISSFLEHGTPSLLMQAVIETKQRFNETTPHGLKSESDRWVYDLSYYRPILIEQVKETWASMTEQPAHECPWVDDLIVHMWVTVRKSSYTTQRLQEDVKKACSCREGVLFSA